MFGGGRRPRRLLEGGKKLMNVESPFHRSLLKFGKSGFPIGEGRFRAASALHCRCLDSGRTSALFRCRRQKRRT
ncbi:hypothetical protein GS3922_07600 [Geobacillus subterraneus]|uniref:Uncharacterized protein n=1 Tax=Geobacillus subterraneus TaxID=129338 RepID=A0ABN4NG25_9BACL|nr:hypothetical protein GS3922_07600 [Geobacillus subterraneus]